MLTTHDVDFSLLNKRFQAIGHTFLNFFNNFIQESKNAKNR